MPTQQEERTTFLEVAQIVERTHAYAEHARDHLIIAMQQPAVVDERTRIFLEMFEGQRAELDTAIARATEEAPASLLETRVQYTVDPWDTHLDPLRCTSIEETVRWIVRLDEHLIRTYQGVAQRADNGEEVRAFFRGLADMRQSFDRRMALASQTSHDL